MKYLRNVKSFEDLKEQFRKLIKINHPDAGGNIEIMKEINCEYDILFPIWKNKHNASVTTEQQTTETANSTRREFYTENGWKGSNHDWNRTLKEVAVTVRGYVKEKYPTFKFSVRTEYASMCQELHVALKESPFDLYKTLEQLSEEDISEIIRKANRNQEWTLNSWYPEEAKTEIEKIWNKCGDFYKIYRDDISEMLKDIDTFVNSYNFSDCDGMTDYFHVGFYYFDCKPNYDFKIVERTARIKKQTETSTADVKEIEDNSNNYTYDIIEDTDTRDNSTIFVVKVFEKLDREEYIKVNNYMKSIGGYYSKFKRGFIFKNNPTELLNKNNQPKETSIKEQDATKIEKRIQEVKQTEEKFIDFEIEQKDKIWMVKIKDNLPKEKFSEVKRNFATLKGFYSSLNNSFIFKYDPTEKIKQTA